MSTRPEFDRFVQEVQKYQSQCIVFAACTPTPQDREFFLSLAMQWQKFINQVRRDKMMMENCLALLARIDKQLKSQAHISRDVTWKVEDSELGHSSPS